MSARANASFYNEVAQKWYDLAERRCVQFVELYRSGRWERYYTEDQFLACLREAIYAADAWARLANQPGAGARPAD